MLTHPQRNQTSCSASSNSSWLVTDIKRGLALWMMVMALRALDPQYYHGPSLLPSRSNQKISSWTRTETLQSFCWEPEERNDPIEQRCPERTGPTNKMSWPNGVLADSEQNHETHRDIPVPERLKEGRPLVERN